MHPPSYLQLENILLTGGKSPQEIDAKIADFGLSALVHVSAAYKSDPLLHKGKVRRGDAVVCGCVILRLLCMACFIVQ